MLPQHPWRSAKSKTSTQLAAEIAERRKYAARVEDAERQQKSRSRRAR